VTLVARNGRWLLALVCNLLAACSPGSGYEPRNGDIVFQTSRSPQSLAIQLATKSPYSHMGIVYVQGGAPFVFEAVQPVKLTPLRSWIERGAGIEIGDLETIADFDLSHPTIQAKVKERFGDRVPVDETVISPAAMFAAENLVTVYEN
jgi:hypothetical protein